MIGAVHLGQLPCQEPEQVAGRAGLPRLGQAPPPAGQHRMRPREQHVVGRGDQCRRVRAEHLRQLPVALHLRPRRGHGVGGSLRRALAPVVVQPGRVSTAAPAGAPAPSRTGRRHGGPPGSAGAGRAAPSTARPRRTAPPVPERRPGRRRAGRRRPPGTGPPAPTPAPAAGCRADRASRSGAGPGGPGRGASTSARSTDSSHAAVIPYSWSSGSVPGSSSASVRCRSDSSRR